MEASLRTFFNYEQNYWARLPPMAGFAYNNAKNASTHACPMKRTSTPAPSPRQQMSQPENSEI